MPSQVSGSVFKGSNGSFFTSSFSMLASYKKEKEKDPIIYIDFSCLSSFWLIDDSFFIVYLNSVQNVLHGHVILTAYVP